MVHPYPKYKLYTGEEILSIRQDLHESRTQFCRRFLVKPDTIRCWESGRGDISGPCSILLQQIEAKVNHFKEAKAKAAAKWEENGQAGITPMNSNKHKN